MKQKQFENLYKPDWQKLTSALVAAEQSSFFSRKPLDAELPAYYRRACHHLSLAQERCYSSHLIHHLNDLVLRGHQQLYQRKTDLLYQIFLLVVVTFPQAFRQQLGYFWFANGLFYGPAVILCALVLFQPEWVYSVLAVEQVDSIGSMYAPDSQLVGVDRDAGSDFQMFGHYIKNNISIGFQTFATGIFFGLGSIYYLFYNGIFFGALAAHMINIQYHKAFFSFVVGHGAFELTAIVIAGSAGLILGHALIKPLPQQSRLDTLTRASKPALQLIYGAFIMLIIAAFIEAFWSSNGSIATTTKAIVGALLWIGVLSYLTFAGRRHQPKDSHGTQ